jgi:ABC-type amino acid transport substrate-binding protein
MHPGLKTLLALGATGVTFASAACVPPPNPLAVKHFNATTAMGEIQKARVIKIGVPTDAPPFGYRSHRGGTLRGFDVQLGKFVADALGVEARFIGVKSRGLAGSRRLISLMSDGSANVVFPLEPITETAVRRYSFTDPYYVAHQRLLVAANSTITNPSDLSRKTVCSYIDPATEIPPTTLASGVRVIKATTPQDCVRLIKSKKAVAATSADVFLMGMRAALLKPRRRGTRFVIRGDALTTEGYGAVVETSLPGLAAFVDNVLGAIKNDGRWTEAYRRWIAPYTNIPSPQPPRLSLQEAAALFPTGVKPTGS